MESINDTDPNQAEIAAMLAHLKIWNSNTLYIMPLGEHRFYKHLDKAYHTLMQKISILKINPLFFCPKKKQWNTQNDISLSKNMLRPALFSEKNMQDCSPLIVFSDFLDHNALKLLNTRARPIMAVILTPRFSNSNCFNIKNASQELCINLKNPIQKLRHSSILQQMHNHQETFASCIAQESFRLR